MTSQEFNKLKAFFGSEESVCVIPRKLAFLDSSDERAVILSNITKKVPSDMIFRVNINVTKTGSISLQDIPNKKKGNALIVRENTLFCVLNKEQKIEDLLKQKLLFRISKTDVEAQISRKIENKDRQKKNKETSKRNAESLLDGTHSYLNKKDWIRANKIVLTKKSTIYEDIVFHKLQKALKKRVNRQVPFPINGNIYFADICIKCKRLIIEVDGGYHNTESRRDKDAKRDKDFESIGYTTIRITNEEASVPSTLSDLINMIIKIPNRQKKPTVAINQRAALSQPGRALLYNKVQTLFVLNKVNLQTMSLK